MLIVVFAAIITVSSLAAIFLVCVDICKLHASHGELWVECNSAPDSLFG